jgi:hypothetical protein
MEKITRLMIGGGGHETTEEFQTNDVGQTSMIGEIMMSSIY